GSGARSKTRDRRVWHLLKSASPPVKSSAEGKMVRDAGFAASFRTSLRARRVPVARSGRRLVPALGRAGVELLVAADLGREPARRQPLPGRRLADLHDLRLDAGLRALELAPRDRRARQAAADADL